VDLFSECQPPEQSQYGPPIRANVTVPAAAVPRINRQCRLILERLREGRATNATLCGIGMKYNARISELRKAGYDVRCISHDHATGLAWYALYIDGREVAHQ
jgi:hypothetical protein